MKLSKLSFLFFASLSLGVFVGCEDDSATDNKVNGSYVSLGDVSQTVVVPPAETLTVQGKIYASHASNVDRVIDLQLISESAYNTAHPNPETGEPGTTVPVTTITLDDVSIPATVIIPAGETEATFNVNITDTDLGFNGKRIVIAIVPKPGLDVAMRTIGSVANEDFEVLTKRLVINAVRRCDENSLRVEVFTDSYGSETTWELYDASFNYVDGITGPVGPYQDGTVGVQDTRSFCLTAGEYTLAVYDSEEDGMNDGTNQGYVRLYTVDAAGNETEIYRTGTFPDSDIYTFTLN